MNDEAGFLSKLFGDPADDTTRLVYADWLTERGDPESAAKAQFLRLTVRFRQSGRADRRRSGLQPLAAELPPEWLGVVSGLKIEGCPVKAAAAASTLPPSGVRLDLVRRGLFQFVCDQGWEEMSPTDEAMVRHCARCDEAVHYCATITEAREHAGQGHCVAVDLGIVRHKDDLAPPRLKLMLGRPSAATIRKKEERPKLDPVSEARETRKQQPPPGAAG